MENTYILVKILMVCLGNVCRSPLAEGILSEKVKTAGLNWKIYSAGTGKYHEGEEPDPRSMAIAEHKGLDISTQRSRQFGREDFCEFDRIYVMDSSNYKNVIKLASSVEDAAKVSLIMDHVSPGMNVNIPDPYWQNDGFDKVYKMLDQACDQIVADLS